MANDRTRRKRRKQLGAIPYFIEDGSPKVVLVTTRESRRWSIPKGNPMKGLKAPQAAAIEAYEEAGLHGEVGSESVGRYVYEKRGAKRTVVAEVKVFPLRVERMADTFPECGLRDVRVFDPDAALAALEGFPGLGEVVGRFLARLA